MEWYGATWHMESNLEYSELKETLCDIYCHEEIPVDCNDSLCEDLEMQCKCGICGMTLSNRNNLKRHVKYHTGERPFHCHICSKNFVLNSHLRDHMRIHTGERPFTCGVCGRGFAQKSSLGRHTRQVHTGERPVQCTVCGKSFGQMSKVKDHMRIHTGEKPFLCYICDRSFRQKYGLKRHIVTIHNGKHHKKPFKYKFDSFELDSVSHL